MTFRSYSVIKFGGGSRFPKAMADVVDENASNTSHAYKIRCEEFVNQFRVGFTDECGRAVEWTIQKDTYRTRVFT